MNLFDRKTASAAGIGLYVLLLAVVIWIVPVQSITLYKWKDATGKLHISDERPSDDVVIEEVIEYEPPPEGAAARQEEKPAPESSSGIGERKRRRLCQLAADARRAAVQARSMTVAETRRAENAAQDLEELRDRVGFDDEEYEDFKDDILDLEEKVRRLQSAAGQAELIDQQADLLRRTAEAMAPGDCPDNY